MSLGTGQENSTKHKIKQEKLNNVGQQRKLD